jgi:hypothetical protein
MPARVNMTPHAASTGENDPFHLEEESEPFIEWKASVRGDLERIDPSGVHNQWWSHIACKEPGARQSCASNVSSAHSPGLVSRPTCGGVAHGIKQFSR